MKASTIPPAAAQWISVCVHNGMCELSGHRVTDLCDFYDTVEVVLGSMEFSVFVREWIKASASNMKSEQVPVKRFWQPWRDEEDPSKQSTNKQLPTAKWKRDRRSRLPEYSRKSDPKIAETLGAEPETPVNSNGMENAPIDMSVRQRGSPPSYAQTVSNPGYRSSYRPSVIQNNAPNREELPPGISMCDPIIDEHFRRSLGNDYLTLFSNNNVSKEPVPVKSPPKVAATNVIELMDTAGLSVDDHFAKALGDTWVKLNKKDQEIKNSTSDSHSLLTI